MTGPRIDTTAVVDPGAVIGDGTAVWHFAHVMATARIGARCVIGQGAFIGERVSIGDGVRIQNNVSVFEGVEIRDHVFVGPSAVFTNVSRPRAAHPRGGRFETTLVKEGVTVGANATIVCGVTLGEHSFVGAGAVVTADVPAYGLVMGNPAGLAGFVCSCAAVERLEFDDGGSATCKACGASYILRDGAVFAV